MTAPGRPSQHIETSQIKGEEDVCGWAALHAADIFFLAHDIFFLAHKDPVWIKLSNVHSYIWYQLSQLHLDMDPKAV